MLKKKLVFINKLYIEFLIIIALFIGGCFEEKSEYTINPDLSGKVTFDFLLTPTNLIGDTKNIALQDIVKPDIEKITYNKDRIQAFLRDGYALLGKNL